MEHVETLRKKALQLMADGGYPLSEDIPITVDHDLQIMGYTATHEGKPHIFISQWSLQTDMVLGLIIHELSHVYRTEKKHPSHNFALQNKILQEKFQSVHVKPYQGEIVRNSINILQDLYADDISFAVYIKDQPHINEFFLGWIHEPFLRPSSAKQVWTNAGYLLSAAFAEANIARHTVIDTDEKITHAIVNFLAHCDVRIIKKYDFFKTLMVHLPETISDTDFQKVVEKYLGELLMLAELPFISLHS